MLFSPQKTVYGASVIIFEGIMAFADKSLLQVWQVIFPELLGWSLVVCLFRVCTVMKNLETFLKL